MWHHLADSARSPGFFASVPRPDPDSAGRAEFFKPSLLQERAAKLRKVRAWPSRSHRLAAQFRQPTKCDSEGLSIQPQYFEQMFWRFDSTTYSFLKKRIALPQYKNHSLREVFLRTFLVVVHLPKTHFDSSSWKRTYFSHRTTLFLPNNRLHLRSTNRITSIINHMWGNWFLSEWAGT